MKTRFIKITAAFSVAAVFCVSTASLTSLQAASSESVKNKENELAEIQKKIDSYNDSINASKDEINGALARKETLDKQIELVESKIASTEELIAEYDNEIRNKNSEIVDMDSRIDVKYENFKSWLRTMQMFGNVSYIDMIMSSDSFVGFLENTERLGAMIKYQDTVMEDIRGDIADVGVQRDSIDKLRTEQLAIRDQMASDNKRLLELQSESENYIKQLEKNQAQYEQYLKDAKEAEDALAKQIEDELAAIAAEQERIRKEEESRRLAQQQNNNPGPNGATSSGGSMDGIDGSGTASGELPSFFWPVEGKYLVSSNFGICRGSYHRGIDIPAPSGTNIYAADSGTVTTAGWHISFGYYIIVSHGNGYATLYAHCSRLYVTKGQSVARGDTIGAVGTTGNSRGNHLHFETYKNGALTDPLGFYEYMKDKYTISIYYG